ncbi:alpha/beta fold hydrolase [Granulicella sp. L60]|uniref:alpha/beta fold hydrolase n=1 Tax=Granulicella sp. L60 TaxID=1641866 RepID=UPI00131AF975
MRSLERAGVRLAFEDTETASPPMLLVHGCGLDHRSLKNLADFFHCSYRIISVDLRGHGESDAPRQDYTMPTFADDLGWLCTELSLRNLVVVGHSMGGNIALELGAYHPRPSIHARHTGFHYAAVERNAGGSLCKPGGSVGRLGLCRSVQEWSL